jgi:hypothetical protein
MRLTRSDSLFRDVHRSGWPYAWDCLKNVASGEGILLDDFVDATFMYRPKQHVVYDVPWVGIFHHPAKIYSPLTNDQKSCVTRLAKDKDFRASHHYLKGAIAMCPTVGQLLQSWLRVPVLCVKHPTKQAPQWREAKRLWQAGFYLRDLRFIYRLDTDVPRARSVPWLGWQLVRDAAIARRVHDPVKMPHVEQLPRLSDDEYDEMMCTSVVVTHLHGAAANNIVIECIARCTPLLVNRLPETEYYLGEQYPMLYRSIDEASRLLAQDGIFERTHQYLQAMDKSWMSGELFAQQVNSFVESLC